MNKVKINFLCVDGGYGWGETGGRTSIIFPAAATDEEIEAVMPGGWIVESREDYSE